MSKMMHERPGERSAAANQQPNGERDALTMSNDEVALLTVTARRHYGRWVVGGLVAAVCVLLLHSVLTNRFIDKPTIGQYLFSPEIFLGLQHTLIITALSMLVGVVLGVIVAAMRVSGNPLASWLAWAFAFVFRGVPILVLLFFVFNAALIFPEIVLGIPGTGLTFVQWDMNTVMTPLVASVVALGLSESAYYSEIVRGGLLSIDPGQREAAQAMGMSDFNTFRKIVLPQAFRIILPPTGNELIGMLKYSSLASVIGYNDLAGIAAQIYSFNLKTVELLLVISFWYFVATSLLSVGQYFLERRYGRGFGRTSPRTTRMSRTWSNIKIGKAH